MRVLAGDVGGTKTAIATVDIDARRSSFLRIQRYPSADYPSLETIAMEFLSAETSRPSAAGFGIAGPVREGSGKVTKLPWHLSEELLSRRMRIPRVRLVNDFVAAALGLSYLKPRQLATLHRGRAERGEPVGILGAGTGLGQAAVVRYSGRVEVVPSEGGHADFGPRNPLEDRFVVFLRSRFGRATPDRILSGGGLVLIYDFLKAEGAAAENPDVAEAFQTGEPAAVISRFALEHRDRLCRRALELFVSIYGSEAGNLALQYRATGGVYIAGGIAPKILPGLKRPEFLKAFHDKDPMKGLLARIPVRVVLDWRVGLLGAAASARSRPPTRPPKADPQQ
jgi:glucokinase